jgi:hypothetical protein
MLRHHGGSIPFLKKEMVPDVISPETMMKNVNFFMVSAHGATNLQRFTIVPTDVALVFLGESGFVRDMRTDLARFQKLICPTGYLPAGTAVRPNNAASMNLFRDAEFRWAQEFYDNFFTGKSKSLQFYPNARIYTGGDLLPDTQLTFASGAEQEVWLKGVYSLPVRPKQVPNFILDRPALYFVADQFKQGLIHPEYLDTTCRLKPTKKGDFYTIVFLDQAMREKHYGIHPKVTDFFDAPEGVDAILDTELFYTAPDNLASRNPLYGTHLSDILTQTKGAAPFRFFFFTACRGVMETDDVHNTYRGAAPRNIPVSIQGGPLRRVMRRFSFSSKCDITKGREGGLNFIEIFTKFFDLTMDAAAVAKMKEIGLFSAFRMLAELIQKFVTREGPVPHVYPIHVAQLLNFAYEKIPPDMAAAVPKFAETVEEIREAFGEFTTGLRRESNGAANRRLSVGEMLLRRLGYHESVTGALVSVSDPYQRDAVVAGEKNVTAKVEAKEKAAFHRHMRAVIAKYREAYEAYKQSVRKLHTECEEKLHRSIVAARTERNSERDEVPLRESIERDVAHFIRLADGVESGFEMEQEVVFGKWGHLSQAEKDVHMEESMELIDALGSAKKLLRPLQGLVARLVERAAERMRGSRGSASPGKSNRRNTRRRARG